MKNKKVARILELFAFLCFFLLFSGLLYFLYKPIVKPYNRILIEAVPDYVFRVKKIVKWGVQGESIILLARGAVPNQLNSFKVNGFFLHANIIPVVAIFLASYAAFFARFKEKWWKKLLYILISLFILFLTHLLHLILNCIVTTPYLSFQPNSFLAKLSQENITLLYEVVFYIRVFLEQIGRMVIPFFLWAFFCLRHVLKRAE